MHLGRDSGPRPGILISSPAVASPDEDAWGRISDNVYSCSVYLIKQICIALYSLGLSVQPLFPCVTPVVERRSTNHKGIKTTQC